MRKVVLVGSLVMAAACSSKPKPVGTASPGAAAVAPAAVTTAFLQAVADSNLAQMGELWGTAKGPAAVTGEPTNWLQRLTVIHAYLKGGSARVLGENPGAATGDRVQLMVELDRGRNCKRSVPFTLVRTRAGGWVVNAIDLNAAGVPGRPCGAAR